MNEEYGMKNAEFVENVRALRRMRVIFWMGVALVGGVLCFFAGLLAGGGA